MLSVLDQGDPLRGLDLHLLRCLQALVQERSVTRAARVVGIGQPGMSNALSRLREKLGDPVLVQTSTEMVPTERAQAVAEAAARATTLLASAIADDVSFAPATTRDDFVLCLSDYVAALLLPPLMATLTQEAPHASISVRVADPAQAHRWLEDGTCHLAISYFGALSGELFSSELLSEQPHVLARLGHPRVGTPLTLAAYLDSAHVYLGGVPGPRSTLESVIDEALAREGHQRRVALRIPHALVTPRVVASTDLIATLSRRAADAFAQVLPLQVLPLPFTVPDFTIRLVWHRRTHHLPAHQWLRRLIRDRFAKG